MIDEAYNILKTNSIIVTSQRKSIVQILCDMRGTHLNAERIYHLLRNNSTNESKIGIATIYRTLELLVNKGIVSKIAMENLPAQYELNISPKVSHHHLICIRCGSVEELSDNSVKNFKILVCKANGFLIAEKPMKIYGYCKKCRDLMSLEKEQL